MQEEAEIYKIRSMALCDELISKLSENDDDAHQFFGGELFSEYIKVNDMALSKARRIRSKLRIL